MKPPKPPPIKVPKDAPYSFSGWKWLGGKWKALFTVKPDALKKSKQEWWEQAKRIEELDEMLDRRM